MRRSHDFGVGEDELEVDDVDVAQQGLMLPSTWVTFGSSKQRTTWMMASVVRMFERNLLPRPSPLDAPLTRPAMSTNSIVAGVNFFG